MQILPNNVNTIYNYDELNRLTNISHLDTSQQVLSSFGYSVAADGMRKNVVEQVKQPNSSVENHYITYTYDNLNRLTAEQNYDNEQPSSGNGYAAEYVYDLAGNRLQRTITVNGQSPSLTTIYDYNDNTDRLETEVHTGPVFGMELDGKRYYAYAQAGGGYKYQAAGSNKNIGSIAAYWLGLPSVWAKYIFYAVLILVPLVFFVPVVIHFYRRMGNSDSEDEPAVLRLSLFKRCLCVLLSYTMLLTPGFLESLAEGAISYDEINTCHWSEGDTTIDYTYDDNGSVTAKITTVTSTQAEIERAVYEYNLQNRLNKVKISTDGGSTWDSITEYKYNPDGIRVQKIVDSTVVTDYLIDNYNHTGHAQVLEETTDDGQTVETITYTIGDDIITQSDGTDIEHLLYDGHGSTRQLIEPDLTIVDTFSYDAYGVMLGGNPTSASPAATNLLYTGEQWDNDAQNYYLRARYYNPLNGLFNRTDPFSGNLQDPQSLHKYLYCHANPVNRTDPTGMFSLVVISVASLIVGILTSLIYIGAGLLEKRYYSPQAIGIIIEQAIFFYYRAVGFRCNSWISKTGDPPPFNKYRPDCRCHNLGPFLGQVYEIKPYNRILEGEGQLTEYIVMLSQKYPSIHWYPGGNLLCPPVIPKWQLPFKFLKIQVSLPFPGIIAYNVQPDYNEAIKYGIGAAALTFMILVLNGFLEVPAGGTIPFPQPEPVPIPIAA